VCGQVNGRAVSGMDHQSVVNLLKDAGSSVCLRVSRELFPLADEHNQVPGFCADSRGIFSGYRMGHDRGITAENMEKSQHTDFNEDATNESASVACSNIRL